MLNCTVDLVAWFLLSLFFYAQTFLAIYCLAFATGFGPLPYVVNGELFPMEAKSILASLASSFDWFCIFLLDKV